MGTIYKFSRSGRSLNSRCGRAEKTRKMRIIEISRQHSSVKRVEDRFNAEAAKSEVEVSRARI